jgi:hypothetical protein
MNVKSYRRAVWPIVSCILFGMVVSGLGGVIDFMECAISFGTSITAFSIWGFPVGVGLAAIYWAVVCYNIAHDVADGPPEDQCHRER